MPWDPDQYRIFADERSRPFYDLLGRVPPMRVRTAVDLGCGSGELTRELLVRWPGARVVGVDNSPEMLARAEAACPDLPGTAASPRVTFVLADLAGWAPEAPVDLVFTNAALQWVPDHDRLLPALAAMVAPPSEVAAGGGPAPGGVLAIQMPGNFDAPSHRVIDEMVRDRRWAAELAGVARSGGSVRALQWYVERLHALGFAVDAWETTYIHILRGENPVLEWVRGTALRPLLDRLTPERSPAFESELGARLEREYPKRGEITLFPFRRLFLVARRVLRD